MTNPGTALDIFRHQIALAKSQIAEFRDKLDEDAFSAFEWVRASIEAAACLRVFGEVVKTLEKDTVTIEQIHSFALKQVRRIASNGANHSTRALDSDLRAEELRAWNTVVDILEGKS